MDELLYWLPDGPAGWALVGVAFLALAWWCVRRLPGKLFRLILPLLARKHGWLVKTGPTVRGRRAAAADDRSIPASWEDNKLPRTHLEVLGEHRGYTFHARQQRTRVTGATSFEHGGHSYRWRYDYVVSLAATSTPYDGFSTAGVSQAVADRRLTLYPAFLEWERKIFPLFDSSSYSPRKKFRHGGGMISTEHQGGRLSGRTLLAHLDALTAAAEK
ncbi:hypothetical protein SAMN05216266_10815 [Amycolatopsis marina]|uniref:Uncharacterized protein n=1 Tax=Amycolatopsis marina TaxID=490629 RepID=A0A1I1A324_9PSEU|nr:hypothetical protein [Amycolatopsis marina]SFB30823.1 hypothetical protein SAMN05216266_10815 [Amycolatopsis marina]